MLTTMMIPKDGFLTIIPLFLLVSGFVLSIMTISNCQLFLINVDDTFFQTSGSHRIGLFGYYDEVIEACQPYPLDENGTSALLLLDTYFHMAMIFAVAASILGGFVLFFIACIPCMSCANLCMCNFFGLITFVILVCQSLVFLLFSSSECHNNQDGILGGRGCFLTNTSWLLIGACASWTLASASLCIFPEPVDMTHIPGKHYQTLEFLG